MKKEIVLLKLEVTPDPMNSESRYKFLKIEGKITFEGLKKLRIISEVLPIIEDDFTSMLDKYIDMIKDSIKKEVKKVNK